MKKIMITTPENIEVEYTLADLGSRTAAAVVDTIIQGLFVLLLLAAVFIVAYFSSQFWQKYYGWIVGAALLIYGLISYGYYIAMELSTNGMTLGKKLLKLRTIRNNGQPITLKHSAIRNLFRIFIDMLGVGAVLIFFSKERKRLGDFAASTIVISESRRTRPITLESLEKSSEKFGYYMTKEEYELLREYFERRRDMENSDSLREELKLHFTKKFEDLGILSEWQSFINSL